MFELDFHVISIFCLHRALDLIHSWKLFAVEKIESGRKSLVKKKRGKNFHTASLCIQFLDRENNNKNNTLPLGKQICFTIVWGCAEILSKKRRKKKPT